MTSNKNGIYSWQSYINIYDSTLNAKTSLWSSSDVVNIRNSTINGIKEGILNNTNSTMNISDSTITSDEIAIRTLYGNITITDSTVQSAGNETTIYCVNPKVTLNIIGGTIENTGSGCAIFELDGGVNSVSDISISGGAVISSQNPNANSGTIYVWNVNSSFKLYGATVTNTSSTGNAIFCGDSLQINIRNGNNLIYGGSLAIKGKVPIVRMGMKGMASLEVNGDDKEDYDAENINMYKYLQFVPANVAQIDDVIYTSLQEAVDHADNKIIKLLESTALEAPIDTKGKSFILDLNGNTIDSENGTAIEHNGGTLTIEDNVGGGMITSKGADSTIKLTNDSKLIVTGGTISYAGNGDSTIHHDSTGNLEVNGGTVENTYYSYNLYTRAVIHSTGSGDVIVDGGTVKCNKNDNNMRVIYNDSDGDIIVSEGTVEALGGTAIANYGNGNVIVSGGTVEANLGRAIYNYKSGKITISGEAEIKGQSQSYGMIYLNEGTADDTVLEISGGTISNEYNSGTAIYNNASGKISIHGGTCVIWGKGKAMNKLPVLVGELRITASISHTDGTNVIIFNAETLKTISNYKYLRFEPATAPDAPTDVTATAGDGKATVRFTAPAFNGGSEITVYTVKSNPDSITATGTTTEIEVTGLTNGVSYTFTVTATNSIGESMASSESNSVTPKGNQTITFINPGDQDFGTELTLSATASSGLPVTYTSETPEVCTVTSEGEVTFLKAGTATIKVSQEGNAAYLPAESVTQSFTVNAVKPGAPTDFVVIPGDGQLTLTWTAPADTGGSSITDYEYSINDGTWVSTNSTETRYTVTELTNGTIYTIKVRAVNSKGSGEESISIEAIPVKATHTITATAGTGGSISPNGSVMVNQGESQTFTITPDSNYSVEDVKVDGIRQGKIASYNFSDVSTNHSIAATFSYIGGSSGRSSDNDRDSERDRSSSNSNSIINITPASPDNPDSPTQAEIKVPVTVDADNNATVNITSQNVTEAYEKALAEAKKNGNEENGITLVLNVDTGNKAIDIIKVNLPKAVQDAIIAKKIVNTIIVVDNPDIQITMDLTTVKEINRQANADVNVTSATVDSSNLTDEAKRAIGSRPVYDLKVNYGSGRQVENFGDGSVTVTIPYTLGENEKAENICAVYIDDNGKVHWLTDSVYDSVEKVLRFSTNHFSLYGVGYKEEVKTFTDIENHWAKNDIEFVVRQGLFNGTSETSFSPNMAMTRGMFVTVLGRMAKADVSGYKESSFTDVKEDAYYMGYIEWARESGIIKGTGDGKFAPDQSISREQMAVILVNYAKTHGFKLPKVNEEKAFADSDKISAYAKEAVQEMQMSGIINGKDSNLFDPKGMATRAEVSAVLRRFVELISSGVQTY